MKYPRSHYLEALAQPPEGRNCIQQIKAPNFLEEVLARDTM